MARRFLLLSLATLLLPSCTTTGKPPGPRALFGSDDDSAQRAAEEKIRASLSRPFRKGGRCGHGRPEAKSNRSVVGRILLPQGTVALGGATVRLLKLSGAEAGRTTSDGCGRFMIDAPEAGSYTLAFEVRSFKGQAELLVDGMAPVTEDFRVSPTDLHVAVVGDRTALATMVLGALGLRYTRLSAARLPWTRLSRFDIVLVGDGSGDPNPQVVEKLRKQAARGRSVCFLGPALAYLTAAWPDRLTSKGKGPGGTRRVDPVDPELKRSVGPEPLTLRFGDAGQPSLGAAGDGVRVLLEDQGQPQMLLFPADRGLVGYSTVDTTPRASTRMLTAMAFLFTRM